MKHEDVKMKKAKTYKKLGIVIGVLLLAGSMAAGFFDRKRYISSTHVPYGIYEAYVKRPLDFICGMLAILVFLPIYILLILLVKQKIGSPVFFTQERPGKDGKIFKLYKFRTMTNERDENGDLLPDEMRLTKFGNWLRETSLDELPEAINIVKGDMSVIGPRPLLVKYLGRYNEEQKHRHDVRPGLSGYAQVHGRNALSWEEKFKMDVDYVNHITFLGDVKILLETIKTTLRREGISSETSVTMEEFMGTEEL